MEVSLHTLQFYRDLVNIVVIYTLLPMEVNHSLIELCKCVLESFLIEERPIEYRSQNCISHMLSSQLLYKQDRDFHVTHLYVKNKHGSVRPHVEYIMSGLGTSCLDLLLCCLLHICHVFMSSCCCLTCIFVILIGLHIPNRYMTLPWASWHHSMCARMTSPFILASDVQ